MSTDRDTTRIVRSWLEDGATALPDRVLDGVLDQLPATHQRRPLRPRWALADVRLLRFGTAAAALAVALVVVLNILPALGPGQSPAPSPSPSPHLVTHASQEFPVPFTVQTTSEWSVCGDGRNEFTICRDDFGERDPALGVLIVDNVVVDPCNADQGLLDPPPGRSVDDLVAAITNLPGFTSSAVREITLDGFAGKEFTLIAPLGGSCFLQTWATAERINGVAAGERNLMRILDVDGTRVVVSGAYHPTTRVPEADDTDLAAMMDSVDFTP